METTTRYDGLADWYEREFLGAVPAEVPLGQFLQSFFDAGFRVEWLEEPRRVEYPYMIGLRCRK